MDTTASRERGYHDQPALALEGIVDLDDPIERTAIAMHRMTFAVPDEVASMFGSRPAELAFTWTRIEPAARHLWRRRAAVALAAAEPPPAPADVDEDLETAPPSDDVVVVPA